MKVLNFKEELQKIENAKKQCYDTLLTELTKEEIETSRKVIEKNFNYLYQNIENLTIQNKCYNVLFNTLRVITNKGDITIKNLFTYANLSYSVEMLSDSNEDTKVYEEDNEEMSLIFVFNKNETYTFNPYNYRIEEEEKTEELISFSEYAKIHNVTSDTIRQRANRGLFKSAKKIGRNWVIDKNEPYIDNRISNE